MTHQLETWRSKLKENIHVRPRKSIDVVKTAARRAGWKQRDVFVYRFMAAFTLFMVLVIIILVIVGVFLPPTAQLVEDFRLNTDYRNASAPFTSLAMGPNGKLLLGSDGRGLQVYNTDSGALGIWQQVTHASTNGGLLDDHISSLAIYNQRFWAAAEGGLSSADLNLSQWDTAIDTSAFKALDAQQDISVVCLTADKSILFVGTNSYGLGIYDTKKHRWVVLNSETGTLPSDTINALGTGLGAVWVGTDTGLEVFDLKSLFDQSGPSPQTNLALPERDIRQITINGQDIWVRTAAGGIEVLREEQNASPAWRTLIGEDGFPAAGDTSTGITAVAQIGQRLFIGTSDNGVGVYDTQTHNWDVYSRFNGLSSDVVRTMLASSQTLWIATAAGINSFNADTNQWSQVNGTTGKDITRLKVNGSDIWYVAASGEVGVYHILLGSSESVIGSDDYGTANASTAIQAMSVYNGLIWVASSDQGVASYDPQRHNWQMRNAGLPSSNGPDEQVVELQVMNGGLWSRLASGTGSEQVSIVYRWQDTQWVQASQNGQNVRAMVGDDAVVWFLLDDGSLINQGSGQRYFDSAMDHAIQFNSVVNIGGNDLYLSSLTEGIWHYDLSNHSWRHLSLKTSDQIQDLATNGDSIWYVTRNGGVGNFQPAFSSDQWIFPEGTSSLSSSPLVVKTVDVYKGSFWFADKNGRVYEYNPLNYVVQKHSGGLDLIGSNTNIQRLQIRASTQSLWYLVVTRNEQQDTGALYKYDTLQKSWAIVSNADQNVVKFEVQGDQVWYDTDAGEVVKVPEADAQQAYFSGAFPGLTHIIDSKADDYGRIWVASGDFGAAYYTLATHNWQSVPIPDALTVTAITIVPGQSTGTQEAYFTTSSGLYHATLSSTDASEWYSELTGYKILDLVANGSTLYALAKQDGQGIWLFKKTTEDWVPVLQDAWLGTDVSLRSALVYQDQLWGIGSDGNLWMYDLEQNQLRRITDGSTDGSNELTSLSVMDDRLWAFFSSHPDNTYQTDVYEVESSGTDYQLTYWYTAPVPPQQVTIIADRIWQIHPQGQATVSTQDGTVQTLINGPTPEFQLPAARELILRYPLEWVLYPAIAVSIILAVVWAWSWRRTKRNRVTLLASAILMMVAGAAYSYLYDQIMYQRDNYHAIAVDSVASSIIRIDNKIWVGTNEGVWQFSYNSKADQVVADGYDPLGPIEALREVGNGLYAQLQNGQVKQYASGWRDVAELPPAQDTYVSDHWKVVSTDENVDIQLKDSTGKYHPVTFVNGGFQFDQINQLVMQGRDLWMATDGGVAHYKPNADGSGLTLVQLYDQSDGLPDGAVQNCTVADKDKNVICSMDNQELVRLEGKRWQLYSGQDPFDAVRTVYQSPSLGLTLQVGPNGGAILPANLVDTQDGKFTFDCIQDITTDDQGAFWVKTPSGAWQASNTGANGTSVWNFTPLSNDVNQRFDTEPQRQDRQTWPIVDPGWQWKRSVNPAIRQDQVQISLLNDPRISRQFTSSGKFADQFVQAVWAEKTSTGETSLWLGMQNGIWKALYSPGTTNVSGLKLTDYYPVNSTLVDAFRQENGKLYAQTALPGQTLVYDPVQDDWTTSNFDPFLESQTILSVPNLDLLIQETTNSVQINPIVEAQGHFSFDIIQGIATQSGFLWVATQAGVLQYKLDATGLVLVKHYSSSDGLSSDNVTGIRTDQHGDLYSAIDNGQAYFHLLSDKKWYDATSSVNPFQISRMPLENVPGVATWYIEGGRIYPEFQGQPVVFQNGRFDFDNVTDAFIEKDSLWLLSSHGILQYNASSPIEFQSAIPTLLIGDPPQKITRQGGQTFVRSNNGSYSVWQQNSWQDRGTCQDQACPFQYLYLQLQDARWQSGISPDDPNVHALIRIGGIPPDQIFDPGGKFSFDFAQSIAATDSQAWIATRGGLVQLQTQPDFSMSGLSTLDNGLPRLNVSYISVMGDQAVIGFIDDESILEYDPVQPISWKAVEFTTYPFTTDGAVFEDGTWRQVFIPENEPASLLQVPDAPPGFQLFDASGKFSFDYVEQIQKDGPILSIRTRAGLVEADYQDGRFVIQKIDFNTAQTSGAPPLQMQFQLSDNSITLVLKIVPGSCAQIWRDNNLLASYSNTEKYLGLFGSQVPIDSVIGAAQDDQRIYLVTDGGLIIINKFQIERELGPLVPDTPTPTVTQTPSPTGTMPITATPTMPPVPRVITITPSPTSTALPQAIVLYRSNIRSGPGTDYPVMAIYAPGMELTVTGRNQNGGWLHVILLDDREGWIYAKLVRLMVDISILPKVIDRSSTPTQ